jgi:hypothetical protein
MKMTPDHYNQLSAAIVAKLDSIPNIWRNCRGQGLTPMRFRWDALHASKFDTNVLYKAGLNDDHIDTALRAICKPYMK